MNNPLDAAAKALHRIHATQPAAYVWELTEGEPIKTDVDGMLPTFKRQLIKLYTYDQLEALFEERDDE